MKSKRRTAEGFRFGRYMSDSQKDNRAMHIPENGNRPSLKIHGSIIDNEAESYIKSFEEDNHAKVVKQARRAGVSTEGTTDEILERINHAKAVKQAKRAGISTEGTTDEILDRINHAKVVKQAKRAGVSTEGTTKEILERIKQKNIDKHTK